MLGWSLGTNELSRVPPWQEQIRTETDETAATIATPAGTQTTHADEIDRLDAYWRAANYLSVGQIYLSTTRCCENR